MGWSGRVTSAGIMTRVKIYGCCFFAHLSSMLPEAAKPHLPEAPLRLKSHRVRAHAGPVVADSRQGGGYEGSEISRE
jgi:hypothetical protein